MSPTLKKNLKRVLRFMALVLLASLVLHLWHVNDDEAHESRAYISNTKEVQSLVGDIISIDF